MFKKIFVLLPHYYLDLVKSNHYSLSQKANLSFDLCRYCLKTIIVSIFKKNYYEEKLLNYKVDLANYSEFVSQFLDIFCREIYFSPVLLEKNIHIIDAGSNIGIASLYFHCISENAKITCIEPDLKTFQILTKNISKNMLPNIKVRNAALGRRNYISTLYTYSKPDYLSKNPVSVSANLFSLRNLDNGYKQKVNVVTLDKVLSKHSYFIKLDIEGAETIVLKKIKSLHSRVKAIILEHHQYINMKHNSLAKLLNEIEPDYDYYVYPLDHPVHNADMHYLVSAVHK